MAEPSHLMIAPNDAPAPRYRLAPAAIACSSAGAVIGSGWLPRGLPSAVLTAEQARLYIVDSSSEEPLLDTAQ